MAEAEHAPPDAPQKKPAATNPWYILMTVAGEQQRPFDDVLHARNRRYWNGWAAQGLNAATREA